MKLVTYLGKHKIHKSFAPCNAMHWSSCTDPRMRQHCQLRRVRHMGLTDARPLRLLLACSRNPGPGDICDCSDVAATAAAWASATRQLAAQAAHIKQADLRTHARGARLQGWLYKPRASNRRTRAWVLKGCDCRADWLKPVCISSMQNWRNR